jgi:hypothetical protein
MPVLGTPIIGDDAKTGIAIPGDFSLVSGVRKATIVFGTAFPDASYTIILGTETAGGNQYNPIWESKTASQFVINLGTSSLTGLAGVSWQAKPVGE